MFFIASKIFEFFAAPSQLALFVAFCGTALLFTRYARAGRVLCLLGALALFALGFAPVGNFLAAPLEARFPAPPDDMPAPDGVIVLGGSVDETLSALRGRVALESSAERLTAPLEILRKYPGVKLVFTGGSAALRGSNYTEAQAVRNFWRGIGLDQGAVLYEDRSRNTFENAVFTRDLLRPKPSERWLLVTSAAHMPRSVGIFRHAGFPVIAWPVDFRTTGDPFAWRAPRHATQGLDLVDAAAHEWLGLVAYRLTGKIDDLFPAP